MKHYPPIEPIHLSPRQLSERLGISQKKLAHDRIAGSGVSFRKIGRLVRYSLDHIIAYEKAQLRRSTSDRGGSDV